MKVLDIPKSGRLGDLVFYRVRGRQYARRYVVPALRRTRATARARGSLGALSKMWRTLLSQEQRQAWNAAAARVRSRPRLEQAGPLTGQAHFVGINSARARIDREVLVMPPGPVLFLPNPVAGLVLSRADGQVRLKLSLGGPVEGDIMVFGAAPCRSGWKKWRHGSYLGLLPPPVGGESDITELYVARYGEPEPGKRVLIRTVQQREGWEGHPGVVSEVVGVVEAHGVHKSHELNGLHRRPEKAVAVAEARREIRLRPPSAAALRSKGGSKTRWPGRAGARPCTREQYRIRTGVSPSQYRLSTGTERGRRGAECRIRVGGGAKGRRKGHWRELWHGT